MQQHRGGLGRPDVFLPKTVDMEPVLWDSSLIPSSYLQSSLSFLFIFIADSRVAPVSESFSSHLARVTAEYKAVRVKYVHFAADKAPALSTVLDAE